MYALEFQSTVQNIIAAVPQGKQDEHMSDSKQTTNPFIL